MAITRIDTETGDFDLTVKSRVLSSVPSLTEDKQCQVHIELGDGTNDLDGSGGPFELTLKVGGNEIQPAPQPYEFGSSLRAAIKTAAFIVPAELEVQAFIKSPNAADTNVNIKAFLFGIPEFSELIIDSEELRAIINEAMQGLTIQNKRIVLGPCNQPTSTVSVTRLGCGAVKINRN